MQDRYPWYIRKYSEEIENSEDRAWRHSTLFIARSERILLWLQQGFVPFPGSDNFQGIATEPLGLVQQFQPNRGLTTLVQLHGLRFPETLHSCVSGIDTLR